MSGLWFWVLGLRVGVCGRFQGRRPIDSRLPDSIMLSAVKIWELKAISSCLSGTSLGPAQGRISLRLQIRSQKFTCLSQKAQQCQHMDARYR